MVLLLLISLAFLLWTIQGELNAADQEVRLPAGSCPSCRAATDLDWMVCPHCQNRLRESCGCCHKSKPISQNYCPFCGTAGESRAA
jgi:hypothetical protein